jgi:hypothetical protein
MICFVIPLSSLSESEENSSGSAFSLFGIESEGDIMVASGFDDVASELMLNRRSVGRSGVDFERMGTPAEPDGPLLCGGMFLYSTAR